MKKMLFVVLLLSIFIVTACTNEKAEGNVKTNEKIEIDLTMLSVNSDIGDNHQWFTWKGKIENGGEEIVVDWVTLHIPEELEKRILEEKKMIMVEALEKGEHEVKGRLKLDTTGMEKRDIGNGVKRDIVDGLKFKANGKEEVLRVFGN